MIEIRKFTKDEIESERDFIFIINDSDIKLSKNSNKTLGIRVRKGPSNRPASFYNDSEYKENIKKITEDVLNIKSISLNNKIILSSDGYGKNLIEKSPNTYDYLCSLLERYFNFDNKNGCFIHKIPGTSELSNGKYIKLYNNDDILQPSGNALFRNEHLLSNLNNTFQLITNGKKVSFTSSIKYNIDDILIIDYPNDRRAICKVINSYKISDIKYNNFYDIWSMLEGFNNKFIEGVSRETIDDKFQTHFKFIYTLNNNGDVLFRDGLFNKVEKDVIDTTETTNDDIKLYPKKAIKADPKLIKENFIKKEEKDMEDTNKEILRILKRIEDKLDGNFNKPKKQTKSERIIRDEINGDIISIERIDNTQTYKVHKKLDDKEYYHIVRIRKWKLINKCKVIFTTNWWLDYPQK